MIAITIAAIFYRDTDIPGSVRPRLAPGERGTRRCRPRARRTVDPNAQTNVLFACSQYLAHHVFSFIISRFLIDFFTGFSQTEKDDVVFLKDLI